jgi:hypothetical protein
MGFIEGMARGAAEGQDFEYAEAFRRIWFDREGPTPSNPNPAD